MPQLLFAALLCLLYGLLDVVAIPALLHPRALSTPSTMTSTRCTYATVTVISTQISVSTKTHTVTERDSEPTRLGADKPRVHIDTTPFTKPHSTSTNSSISTTRVKNTAPALAVTRRADEKAESDECPTAAIIPAPLNVKTTSASPSTASTTKSTKKTSKAATTTEFAIAHISHIDRRSVTALPGHPKHENSPTHD